MMDELKKNELNEQEMENVTGGSFYHPHHPTTPNQGPKELSAFDKAMHEFVDGVSETAVDAYNTVSEAADTAWEVVKYTFEKNFLK